MTSFFGELGRKVAERWLSLLLLPSLLLAAIVAVAVALGHRAALDGPRLVATAEEWVRALSALPVAAAVLLLGVLLLACSGAGLLARAAAVGVARLWWGDWPRGTGLIARVLTRRRERRWSAAAATAVDPTAPDTDARRAALRRNAIALARPSRPTWMGDRIAAVDARVHHQYGADLDSWWPRLWLVVDDATRTELRAARTAFDAAALQAAWAIGYGLVAVRWWPAAVLAVGIAGTAWVRGRSAANTYAQLVESTVDVSKELLARRLALLGTDERFSAAVGRDLTDTFRKAT